MSLFRPDKQRDRNEPELVDALRKVGARVYLIDLPADLLVWFRNDWWLLEVKDPERMKRERRKTPVLTDTQKRIQRECGKDAMRVVLTVEDALRAIGAWDGKEFTFDATSERD